MQHKIIISIIMLVSVSANVYAADKTGTTKATATLSPSCQLKVSNMNFGNVSMQAMSGNGDIFATSQLSLFCTKDQAVTFTSNLGMNANTLTSSYGGNWINATLNSGVGNFYCQKSYSGPPYNWVTAGTHPSGSQGFCVNSSNGQAPNPSNVVINSTPVYKSGFGDNAYYRAVYMDGSLIPNGTPMPAGIPYQANMTSGSNKISYVISTNSSTYAPINSVSSNPLTYNLNNGNWQDFTLYGKSNVAGAVPGSYVDTNTITVAF